MNLDDLINRPDDVKTVFSYMGHGEMMDWFDLVADAFINLSTKHRKLQEEFSQLRAERAWQDISTAPKDGTKILAYLIDNAEQRKSFPENERDGIDIIVWTNHNKGGWISNRFGTPTHWMPLPDKLTDSAQSIKEGE